MIEYDRLDQSKYYAERSYYICSTVGLNPELITMDNYYDVRELLFVTFSGGELIKVRNELSNILLFSNTVGYAEEVLNA
jgi:hypothetical protein